MWWTCQERRHHGRNQTFDDLDWQVCSEAKPLIIVDHRATSTQPEAVVLLDVILLDGQPAAPTRDQPMSPLLSLTFS